MPYGSFVRKERVMVSTRPYRDYSNNGVALIRTRAEARVAANLLNDQFHRGSIDRAEREHAVAILHENVVPV